jgi:hypothetical protein
MTKQTKGEKLAHEVYRCAPQTADEVAELAKKIDKLFAKERKRALWDGYAYACNGVLPAGMEVMFGKCPKN